MFNLGLKWTDFYEWTEKGTTLHRYAFNSRYWNECLYPTLEKFYMDQFLPEAIIAIKNSRDYDPVSAKFTKRLHL